MPHYALVDILVPAVHHLMLVMLVEAAGIDAGVAPGVGAACRALVAYAGNRRFNFASDAPHARTMPRFVAVAAAACVAIRLLPEGPPALVLAGLPIAAGEIGTGNLRRVFAEPRSMKVIA